MMRLQEDQDDLESNFTSYLLSAKRKPSAGRSQMHNAIINVQEYLIYLLGHFRYFPAQYAIERLYQKNIISTGEIIIAFEALQSIHKLRFYQESGGDSAF